MTDANAESRGYAVTRLRGAWDRVTAQPRYCATLAIAAVAALALFQSWQRWLDPIIDTGRDLYIPEQLARGAKLYRDIRYQYLPLAPYLLVLIGRSLAAYAAFGIAQSVVVAGALWTALRRNALAATIATLFFVALSMCGASTWGANFIFPYSYAATIGMALLMIALAALVHERVPIAFAALLLASWCKVEYAVAAAIVIVVVAITRRATWRQLGAFVAAWIGSAAVVAFAFRDTQWLAENVFARALTQGTTAKHFFSVVAGTANWPLHAGEMLFALIGTIVVVLLLSRNKPLFIAAAMVISLLIADHSFFRAWALLEVLCLVYALAYDRRSPLALFAAFAIATTLRIPANVSPIWYGFVLIVPVYALIAYVLFVYLPERGLYSQRAALAWLPLMAIICFRDLAQQRERWAAKEFPIRSARGVFYDSNQARAAALQSFIDSHPAGALVVLPEGITINYLTKTTTTLTFHTFTPVETADPQIEDQILREIEARPPDRIAVVARDVTEYGYRGFGIDYDLRLAAWIRSHYRVERAGSILTTLKRR